MAYTSCDKSCWTLFDTSASDIEEITGWSNGKTMSSSMLTKETAEGGGNGDVLRKIPMKYFT
jgi:hypothetical protein